MLYYTTEQAFGHEVLHYGGLVYIEWESHRMEIPRALKELEKQALAYQSNAIIGLQLQLTYRPNGEPTILAYGTAVKLNLPEDLNDNINTKSGRWFK